jgi:hypothetical protein
MAISGFNESAVVEYELFNESKLGESIIFKKFDEADNVLERAKKLIGGDGRILTREDIESQYMSIRQYADSFSKAALSAFDNGTIKLIYAEVPKNAPWTQAIPFLSFRQGNKLTTYIFMNEYAGLNRQGKFTIVPATLNILFRSAFAANRIKENNDRVVSNQYFQKVTMEIYGKIIARVFMREYLAGSDRVLMDGLNYLIHRFFLAKVFESVEQPESIEKLATLHFRFIDDLKYSELRALYNNTNPQNFQEFIEMVKPLSPRMDNLTLKIFMDRFLIMYHGPALLAIENYEYLIFMIIALLTGGNIISIGAHELVAETKNIKSFNSELLKLI